MAARVGVKKGQRVWKAQWPLSGNAEPMVLLYPVDDRSDQYLMPATPETRKTMFQDKYIRVYFVGYIDGQQAVIDGFVMQEDWL